MVAGDLVVFVLGFQGVGAGSAPYCTSSDHQGWSRLAAQDPSASGCGIEVIAAYWSGGATVSFNFNAAYTWVSRGVVFTNARRTNDYPTHTGTDLVTPTDFIAYSSGAIGNQTTGNNPATATRYSYVDELVFVASAVQLAAPGYGATAGGFSTDFDNTEGGFGTVEIVVAYNSITSEGNKQGSWTATTSPAGAKGSNLIFGVRPYPREYPITAARPFGVL
jgi:hypothetical protein